MKQLKNLYFLCIFLFASHQALLSQCAIKGTLTDSLNAPVSFNALGLIQAKDSSIVKGVMTDVDGRFCFENIAKGNYRLKISAIGYKEYLSDMLMYDSTSMVELPAIRLQSGSINLNEVAIEAQKKTVEFKNGNVIVNIEGTALAMGNTAYDLLQRLPGVTVSDENISIQGKGGVKILIDGKLQTMAGTQLINVLKSMNSSEIEKMEVLKKPPVKYDAAGTGGMINIKTKKVKLVGFSGSVFGSYSQGYYGIPAGGFTLNYKGRKVNFFSGFNANNETKHVREHFTNKYNYQTANETTVQSDFTNNTGGSMGAYNLGADWTVNKSNTIGVKMNGAFGMGKQDQTTSTDYGNEQLGFQTLVLNSNKPNPWIYPEFNVNAEHLFDTSGTTLHFSANYNPYWDIYAANFDNHYLNAANQDVITPSVFKTSNTLTFNNSNAVLDFEKEFKKELKLEIGLKHSYQEMRSDYFFKTQDPLSGEYIADTGFTNVFNYYQNISAAYLNLSKQYKKFSFQAGARAENTTIHTTSKNNGMGFDRQYVNVFPLASIDWRKSDKQNFSLSYNKRVNRPDYNSFNPFVTFISTQVSYKGNPFLKPEYSHDIGFTHSYDSWLNNSINVTRIYNTFMGYNTQNDSTQSYVHTTANLKHADIYSYSLFIQKELFKWWTVNFNAIVFNIKTTGIINNLPYAYSTTALSSDLYSRITLPKKYSIELSAFYLSPFLEGIFYTKARSFVNVAFKKAFLNDKLSVALAFNDIFWGQIRNTKVNYQNQYMTGYQTFDTRRINLTVRYSFGKLKVEQRQVKDIEPMGKSGK